MTRIVRWCQDESYLFQGRGDRPRAGEHAILTSSPTGAGPPVLSLRNGPKTAHSGRSPGVSERYTPTQTTSLVAFRRTTSQHRNKPVTGLRKDMLQTPTPYVQVVLIHRKKPVTPDCERTWTREPRQQEVSFQLLSVCSKAYLLQGSDMRQLQIEVQAQGLNLHPSATSGLLAKENLGVVNDATAPLHRNKPVTGLRKDMVQTPLHRSDQVAHTPQQASKSGLRKDMVRAPAP